MSFPDDLDPYNIFRQFFGYISRILEYNNRVIIHQDLDNKGKTIIKNNYQYYI